MNKFAQACSQFVLSTCTKHRILSSGNGAIHGPSRWLPTNIPIAATETLIPSDARLGPGDDDNHQSTLGVILCYTDVRTVGIMGHDHFLCLCRKLYHHNNAQLGMAVMRAGLTNWHAGHIEEGHGMICKAYAILLVTHGPSHPITKDLEVNSILEVGSHCLVRRSLKMGGLVRLDFALWKSIDCH